MRTDDFLADLERQLAGARPRRRPPVTLALVPLLAAAILAGALLGGEEREREVTAATHGAVLVQNGTGDRAVGIQARDRLEEAGYQVTLEDLRHGATDSGIFGAGSVDEDRIADLLGLEDAGGWSRYAPLEGAAPGIVVVLGVNQHGGGIDPVVVLDASGDVEAAQERLEAAGLTVGGSGGPLPVQRTEVLAAGPAGDELAVEAQRALGLPDERPRRASGAFLDRWVGEPAGGAVVVVGPDYEPPLEIAVFNGTTTAGLGAAAADALRRAGHDVSVANSPNTGLSESLVAGAPTAAESVAEVLGLERVSGEALVTEERTLAPDADVIVVLGADAAPAG